MSHLNIFIDGSWLFKVCQAGGVLSRTTEDDTRPFKLDFDKLNKLLLSHAQSASTECDSIGECFIATSIFALPDVFDDWPNRFDDITEQNIEITRKNVNARERMVRNAVDNAGYNESAVFRPPIRDYIIQQLMNRQYQEKQVDAAVVALLVRSAITRPDDYHVVLTGDSDILPAIKVAYPTYSENVFLATTHPDELKAEHRQTSFSLSNFSFALDPVYLQDVTEKIIQGMHSYKCANCSRVFVRSNPIPAGARPYCNPCYQQRT
ncbi:NYN domain-containing protein [Desulfovermiculus halophilus]|uniref:NYN domain-containing protein n=1 Tax=Desulfovermiculus halophilus TaxID=339722 RepID=UPI00048541D9|nr:NYN domain-containing protein [Desulfovermiculus halophilus]